MILTYADGRTTEGFLLARAEDKIRVAIPGSDDPMELTNIHGTWVSEECEPVRVEFAWEHKTRAEVLSEADCICSHELAARLLHLLWAGKDREQLSSNAPMTAQALAMMSASRGN